MGDYKRQCGTWRLERPLEVQSRERKDWETPRDSEGLGRLERPRRPGEVQSRSGRLRETVRDWGD